MECHRRRGIALAEGQFQVVGQLDSAPSQLFGDAQALVVAVNTYTTKINRIWWTKLGKMPLVPKTCSIRPLDAAISSKTS